MAERIIETRLRTLPGVRLTRVTDGGATDDVEGVVLAVMARLSDPGAGSLFLNASNGLEAAPLLSRLGVPFSVMRLQSSWVERPGKWCDLLCAMPDQALLEMARGLRPVVVDFGARKFVPRSLYQGMPIVTRQLAARWRGFGGRLETFGRGGDSTYLCDEVASARAARMSEAALARADYWGRYLAGGASVGMELVSSLTTLDGDKDFFRACVQRSIDGRAPAAVTPRALMSDAVAALSVNERKGRDAC